jgi:hypothetical protein
MNSTFLGGELDVLVDDRKDGVDLLDPVLAPPQSIQITAQPVEKSALSVSTAIDAGLGTQN